MQKKDRDPIAKALSALTWLVEDDSPDVGVRELAAALNVSPSSAHRLLSALVEVGFARRDEKTARYSLGLEFLRLCHITTARLPIRQLALPHMTQLAEQCGEMVLLGVYDREMQSMMFGASVDAPHPLRYVIELNAWLPVYAGASGIAIMAFLPDDEIEAIIRHGVTAVTEHTLTDVEALREEVRRTRERGYAFTRGQRIRGAIGVGAPIFGSDGDVLGDICVTIPEQRFDAAREQSLAELVIGCANAVSSEFTSRSSRREMRGLA
jgi:DNA-binding IclR family transcriptional regulator